MSTCCSKTSCTDYPKKAVCPVNGQAYQRVARKTLLHHLSKPWQLEVPEQGYYFCDSKDCDVVYFGEDSRTFNQAELRTQVGQKSSHSDRALCYCFDVTQQDNVNHHNTPKEFVIEQTRAGACDCEIRNPSGRCCLKDFPKPDHD